MSISAAGFRRFCSRVSITSGRSDDTGTVYRPVAVSDRATSVGHASGGEGDSNCGQPVQSDAHSSDAGGNPTDQGAPGDRVEAPKNKANYVGAPAIFALEQACGEIREAFGGFGCFLVGSALVRPDWRDVDVRYILADGEFASLFPGGGQACEFWEHDPRWLLLTVSISAWLTKITGLPVDFQFQPQGHANRHHPGPRHAIGTRISGAS